MLKIRLQRTGKVNDPYFRIIVTEHTNKAATGKPVEVIGSHDVQKGKVQINTEKVKYWLSVGAKATPTINNMLITEGIVVGKKVKTIKRLVKKEGKKK